MRLMGADVEVVQGTLAYRGEVAWVDFDQAANPFVARRHPYICIYLRSNSLAFVEVSYLW